MTPVVAVPVTGGFITPLPYGTGTDWLRNVLVKGRATITADGCTFDVVKPTIIDAATAATELPQRRRRVFRAFGISDFVRFTVAP